MRIRQPGGFPQGYTPITALGGPHPSMGMDFGVLKLAPGGRHASAAERERAWLLLDGEAELAWDGGSRLIRRRSLFDEGPWCLHLAAGQQAAITAGEGGAELACLAAANPVRFAARLYAPGECGGEERGRGALRDTAVRRVRTILDDRGAPHSSLALGETVTLPGNWSGYPPHHHPQPEIYHYRFLPAAGFGLGVVGGRAYLLGGGDTVLIRAGQVHPQAAAPGYAMYYLWAIRHLEGLRYTAPVLAPEHAWMTDPEARIWP